MRNERGEEKEMTKKQERSFKTMNESIVRQIRIGMAKEGIKNYTELAKLIGIPRATLYDHLRTPLEYPVKTIHLISLAINVPLNELLSSEEMRSI